MLRGCPFRFTALSLLVFIPFARPAFADDGAPAVTSGPTELTFTDRSPLSELKILAARLPLPIQLRGKLVDYDISQQPFLIYLPKVVDPDKPMGLIVLALYKHAETLPAAIEPELDAANVALIVPKNYLDPWYDRVGLCVDAVYNMQRKYQIDPKRVYVFGGSDWPDKDGAQTAVAWRLGLSFPDVFTGTFTTQICFYRSVPAGDNRFFPAAMPHPPTQQFTLAKTHPFVNGTDRDDQNAMFKAFKSEGFQRTEMVSVSTEQMHYPNLQTGWIPQVLDFLDAATAKLKLPKPTTTEAR